MRAVLTLVALTVAALAASQPTGKMDQKELTMLKGLERVQVAAKAKFAKTPKNDKVKKEYIAATMKYADAVLVSPALAPREKYPKALKLYREVKKVDPKHKGAIANAKMIEDIYRSMNRPIPPN